MMKKILSIVVLVCILASMCTVSASAEDAVNINNCKEGCVLVGNAHTVCVVPDNPDKIRSSPESSDSGAGGTSSISDSGAGGTSGTWGGIDWTLSADGTLTISPTSNPVPDKNCPSKTFASGVWREAVTYQADGEAVNPIGTKVMPYEAGKVKKLIIKEGVTHIGSFVAQNLTNLTGEVVIPASVTYIGQEAFQNTPITKLTFASGGTGELCVGPGAFKNIKITDLVLPYDRPVHLHCWVFTDCTKLENVTLPANVTGFSGWTHVEYTGDMNYVNSGDSQVFARCNNLKTLTFGSDEVKNKFFAAPYNSSNINAISKATGLAPTVVPGAGIPTGTAPVAPAAPVVENIYYVPATADNSNMALWSVLALALLTTAFVTRRKKAEN